MKRSLQFPTVLVLAAVAGCGGINPYARDSATYPTFFLNEQAAAVSEVNQMPWTTYSLGLAACKLEMARPGDPLESSFSCELRARALLLDGWRTVIDERPGAVDPYLDQLLQIEQAGFLNEYVWVHHGEPDWLPPEQLNLAHYGPWQQEWLPDLDPETRILGVWQ